MISNKNVFIIAFILVLFLSAPKLYIWLIDVSINYWLYVVFEFKTPGKGVLTFMNDADGEKYFAFASSTRFSAA